jgi:hypothetical protein
VPYKSGKLWAAQVSKLTEYQRAVARIKAALDPAGVLAPGNLGLEADRPAVTPSRSGR